MSRMIYVYTLLECFTICLSDIELGLCFDIFMYSVRVKKLGLHGSVYTLIPSKVWGFQVEHTVWRDVHEYEMILLKRYS